LRPALLAFAASKHRFRALLGDGISELPADSVETDPLPVLWVVYDSCAASAAAEMLKKQEPVLERRRIALKCRSAGEAIAWIAVFTKLFEIRGAAVGESLAGLDEEVHNQWFEQGDEVSILAVVRYAKPVPNRIRGYLETNGQPTDFFADFVHRNHPYPTLMKGLSEFVVSALQFLDGPTLTWCNVIFYHLLVSEVCAVSFSLELAKVIFSTWIGIIEETREGSRDQLFRFYFLQFLRKSFELEELIFIKTGRQLPLFLS
jgi:hypothetical protein